MKVTTPSHSGANAPRGGCARLPRAYTLAEVLISSPGTLVENENGKNTTLLRNCNELKFSLYKRNPVTNSFNQFPVLTATNEAKVVQVQWQCRTTRIGKAGGQAETTSAKIVLRVKQSLL